MAINKNFVVKNGLEVNTDQIFADSASGKVGIGSTLPTVELDVQGAIAATDVVSSLLRVTGYSTLPQVTVNDNISISGFTTTNQGMNVLGISSLSNLRVVGVTTFENNVNLDGNVNVTGFSTFVGLTSVVGNLKVSGFTTFSNLVDINDNVEISGVTTVSSLRAVGGVVAVGVGKSLVSYDNIVVGDAGVNVTGLATVSSLGSPSEILVVGTGKSLASLGNITADSSGVVVSGVVTATSFSGSFSGTGINIGIQSGGSVVSTATSTINFTVSNATLSVDESDGGAGITTVTITPSGVSIGLAIALGG